MALGEKELAVVLSSLVGEGGEGTKREKEERERAPYEERRRDRFQVAVRGAHLQKAFPAKPDS